MEGPIKVFLFEGSSRAGIGGRCLGVGLTEEWQAQIQPSTANHSGHPEGETSGQADSTRALTWAFTTFLKAFL